MIEIDPERPVDAAPTPYEMLLFLIYGGVQAHRDSVDQRTWNQLQQRMCPQHPVPNAYKCKCSFVRMLHWQNVKCPRCGLTRAQSVKYLQDKAAAEAAHIAKERAKYYS